MSRIHSTLSTAMALSALGAGLASAQEPLRAPVQAPASSPQAPASSPQAPASSPQAPAPAPAPRELDLPAALKLALERNPALQRQLLEEVRRQAESDEARGALMPSLQAKATELRQKINFEALAGGPVHGFPREIGPFSVRSFALETQVPLVDLGLWRRWRGAARLREGSRADSEQMRDEIGALVVGQYLLSLRAEALVRAVQARIELARSLEELARHQEQSGVGTGLDTLRAQVRLRNEEQALLRAQTSLGEAHAGLVRLLDLAPETRLALKPLQDFAPAPEGALAQDLGTARGGRPEFKALEARSQAADERLAGVRALHLPTLSAFATYESMGLTKTHLIPLYSVGLQIKVPVFVGGRIQAQVDQARAARAEVDAARRELDARVAYQLRTARQRLESARSELKVAAEALELARKELEQARHRFEAGVSNNIELVTAQEELAKAEEGHLDAGYRLDQAAADLAHARGELMTRVSH